LAEWHGWPLPKRSAMPLLICQAYCTYFADNLENIIYFKCLRSFPYCNTKLLRVNVRFRMKWLLKSRDRMICVHVQRQLVNLPLHLQLTTWKGKRSALCQKPSLTKLLKEWLQDCDWGASVKWRVDLFRPSLVESTQLQNTATPVSMSLVW